MTINSRDKGKRMERKAAELLKSFGWDAKRGQQHRGGDDSPDVVCPDLPNIHIEVKADRSIGLGTQALGDAHNQACRDATDSQRPVVLWWEHRKGWRLDYITEAGVWATVANDASIKYALVHLKGDA